MPDIKEQIKALRKAGYTADEAELIVEGAEEDGEDTEEAPPPEVSERAAKMQEDLRKFQRVPPVPEEETPLIVDSTVSFDAKEFNDSQPSPARKALQAKLKSDKETADRASDEVQAAEGAVEAAADKRAALRSAFDELPRLRQQMEYDEAQALSNPSKNTPAFAAMQEKRLARVQHLEKALQGKTRPDDEPGFADKALDTVKGWLSSKPAKADEPTPAEAKPAEPATPPQQAADKDALAGALGTTETKVKTDTKATGAADQSPIKAAALAGVVETDIPEYKNSTYTIRNPETGEFLLDDQGAPKKVTGLEAFQQYAEWQAAELNRQYAEYKREADAAKSAAMWTEILRGVAALGMGMYGMKHGVDMSGYKFDPIDWVARQEAERRGYEAGVVTTKEKYKALADVAARRDDQDAADFTRNMQRLAAIEAKNDRIIRQNQAAHQQKTDKDRLKLETSRVALEWRKLGAAGKVDKPEVVKLKTAVTNSLQKAQEFESKGEQETAQAYVDEARLMAGELKDLDPSVDWTADEIWQKPEDRSGAGSLPVIGGLFADEARPRTGGEVLGQLSGRTQVSDKILVQAKDGSQRWLTPAEWSQLKDKPGFTKVK